MSLFEKFKIQEIILRKKLIQVAETKKCKDNVDSMAKQLQLQVVQMLSQHQQKSVSGPDLQPHSRFVK